MQPPNRVAAQPQPNVLECGGKAKRRHRFWGALWNALAIWQTNRPVHAKAVSPLRFATALQNRGGLRLFRAILDRE